MNNFKVIFSKQCSNEQVGEFTFTKIQRTTEECPITGIKGTSETYFFFGNKLHQEEAELAIDPSEYHIQEREYTTPDGKELMLKYLKAKKS